MSSPNLTPAIKVGATIYVSGQVAMDANGEVGGRGRLRRAGRAGVSVAGTGAHGGGASLGNVVKATNSLVDAAHFPSFGAMRRRFFPDDPPASTTVVVKELALPELLVEIEAVAVLSS
jgi:enamine deaminase RidA (YjgF/YER057c/UK114 family)